MEKERDLRAHARSSWIRVCGRPSETSHNSMIYLIRMVVSIGRCNTCLKSSSRVLEGRFRSQESIQPKTEALSRF